MKRRAQNQNASSVASKVRKKEAAKAESLQSQSEESNLEGQRPGVVMVYDRRINVHNYGEDPPSLFELCRAWVQDDPDRPPVTTNSKIFVTPACM
jgi:hypothetical protein